MQDATEIKAQASDPNTPLRTLQTIAQDYPELRPALALNPSTYPDLLKWLEELGDPAVDAALEERSRRAAETVASPAVLPEPSPEPKAQLSTSKALKPAKPASHLDQPKNTAAVKNAADKPAAVATTDLSADELALVGAAAGAGLVSGTAAGAGIATATSQNTAAATATVAAEPAVTTSGIPVISPTPRKPLGTNTGAKTPGERKLTRHNPLFWLALGAVALLVVGAAIMTAINDTEKSAKPVKQPENSTPSINANPLPTPNVTTQVPEGYNGPLKTVEMPGAHPGETLLVVVPDLDKKDDTEASASPSPSASPKANPLSAPTGAKAVSSFTTADGNIRCSMTDTAVQCWANTVKAATNCANRTKETGYTMQLSATHTLMVDCVTPLHSATQTTLNASESATNGQFACKTSAKGSRVMCWNTKDGDGFVLDKYTAGGRFDVGAKLPEFR